MIFANSATKRFVRGEDKRHNSVHFLVVPVGIKKVIVPNRSLMFKTLHVTIVKLCTGDLYDFLTPIKLKKHKSREEEGGSAEMLN